MKKSILMYIMTILCIQCAYSAQKDFEMTLDNNPTPTVSRAVRMQIEATDKDIATYGLTKTQIFNEISSRLSLAQIGISTGPKDPLLLLRIRTIEANRVIATFVQMSFFEDATLIRNNGAILALTWSQASMIACEIHEWPKQVSDSIISMTNEFVLSYNKVFTQSKAQTPQPLPPVSQKSERLPNSGYGP